MKKNKGFTLVEIIVVITIIGIILTLAITSSLGASKKMNEKLYKEKLTFILTAAKQFGEVNKDKIKNPCFNLSEPVAGATCYTIAIKDLVDNKFLTAEDIIDPRDKANKLDNQSIEIQYYYDNIYAVIKEGINTISGSISINKGAASTSSRNVSLSLLATGNDIKEMCISNTDICSAWQTYATEVGWTLSPNIGSKTVKVWFRSSSGEQSQAASASINYNQPSISLTVRINNGDAYVGTRNVNINLSTSDPASSTGEICISNSLVCNSWEAYGATKSWTLTSGHGTKSVFVWYRNQQGDFTDSGDEIFLDLVKPTGDFTINNGNAYTRFLNVNLQLSASDADSGMNQMCISNTNSCNSWETYRTTKTWPLHDLDGTKTVYVWYKDIAGNISNVYTKTIILDRIAPSSNSIVINNGNQYTNNKTVNLKLSSVDADFMCISFSQTCILLKPYNTANTIDLSTGDGTKTIYVTYSDFAGNVSSTVSSSIIFDTTPPTCTNSGDSTTWTRADRTITYGCNPGSGSPCNPSYSGGNKIFNTTTKTDIITTYSIRDLAGNQTACPARTANVYVDKDAPTCTNSGDSTAWTKNDRTITYGCDPGSSSPCNSSYDGGSRIFNTTTKQATIAAYEIRDAVGNVTNCPARTANVYVDKEGPTCTNSGDSTVWTKTDRIIYYGCNSGDDSPCNTSYDGGSRTFNTTTKQATIAAYEIRDMAGNVRNCPARTANVYVDKDAPTCTNSGDSTAWTKNDRTITYGCNPGSGSPCNASYSGGNKIFNTTTKQATIAGYEIRDAVGNVRNCPARTANVYVDKDAPTCTNSGDSTTWTSANRTINYGCNPGSGSPCNSSYDGGSRIFNTTTKQSTIAAYEIRDTAGNVRNCPARTANVYVDKDAPTCTNSGDSTTWTSANRTINYGCNPGSGSPCNASYSGGNKIFNTTTKQATIAAYEIRDAVGNVTNCPARTANVYVDKDAPTCTNSGDSTNWTQADRIIYYGCDSGSGSACNSSYNGGSRKFNTTTKQATIAGYEIRDTAGNVKNCPARTANVYVDKDAPTCVWTAGTWGEKTYPVVNAYDVGSGAALINVSGSYEVLTSKTVEYSSAGVKTAYIQDKVGRVGSCTITISSRTEYRSKTCSTHKSCQSSKCTWNDCLTGGSECVGGWKTCRLQDCGACLSLSYGSWYKTSSKSTTTCSAVSKREAERRGLTWYRTCYNLPANGMICDSGGKCWISTEYGRSSTCNLWPECQNQKCGWDNCLTTRNTCIGGYNSCVNDDCECDIWANNWSNWTTTACSPSNKIQCDTSRTAYR